MLRTLVILPLLCVATTEGYAAPQGHAQRPELAVSSLSLTTTTGPVLFRPAQFSLETGVGSPLRAAHTWPEYSPQVAYDFDGWFKSNATTIAIVAVAIVVLIILAD